MKHFCIYVLLAFNTCFYFSQVPGQWTWKGGSQQPDFAGVYGTKGVSSATNMPPAVYEACEWQDQAGNFWFYGGQNGTGFSEDLWKYDINTQQWTWVNGSGQNNQLPKYGTRGVPSTTNSPGLRMTSATWVDNAGKFWLYGGVGSFSMTGGGCAYSDLWKYDPLANTWTWMKGDKNWAFNPGVYGTKGVEDSLNLPPFTTEMGVTWVDNTNGDLWMLDTKGCLWKYRIQTNSWTWMKGNNNGSNPPPVYGTRGVASLNNTPGKTMMDFTRWKDSKGDFWYLYSRASGYTKVLWKYEITTNMWTWMTGDTVYTKKHNYGTANCDLNDSTLYPHPRLETRTCWVDPCDNLWLMGGVSTTTVSANSFTTLALADLLYYSTKNKEWVWVDGDSTLRKTSSFGTLNVPGPGNLPASRSGALPFKDKYGNLWLFGGLSYNYESWGDLWMYTPDTNCTHCKIAAVPNGTTAINEINATELMIHPNPSSGQINISLPSQTKLLIVTDLFGKTVYRQESPDKVLQLRLTEGVYFVSVSSGENIQTRKIIIMDSP